VLVVCGAVLRHIAGPRGGVGGCNTGSAPRCSAGSVVVGRATAITENLTSAYRLRSRGHRGPWQPCSVLFCCGWPVPKVMWAGVKREQPRCNARHVVVRRVCRFPSIRETAVRLRRRGPRRPWRWCEALYCCRRPTTERCSAGVAREHPSCNAQRVIVRGTTAVPSTWASLRPALAGPSRAVAVA
jgi:hypothetical protein